MQVCGSSKYQGTSAIGNRSCQVSYLTSTAVEGSATTKSALIGNPALHVYYSMLHLLLHVRQVGVLPKLVGRWSALPAELCLLCMDGWRTPVRWGGGSNTHTEKMRFDFCDCSDFVMLWYVILFFLTFLTSPRTTQVGGRCCMLRFVSTLVLIYFCSSLAPGVIVSHVLLILPPYTSLRSGVSKAGSSLSSQPSVTRLSRKYVSYFLPLRLVPNYCIYLPGIYYAARRALRRWFQGIFILHRQFFIFAQTFTRPIHVRFQPHNQLH